jgi:hypothetical protein
MSRHATIPAAIGASLAALALAAGTVLANVAVTQLSSDPYTNGTSQHATQVEPDSFSFGSTIVTAFQSGRFFDGGSSNIGWATSTNGGTTWTHGFLAGITKPANAANPYDRATDPAVAYDARHNVWMISSLPLVGTSGVAVLTSRSTDGGLTWGGPIVVSSASGSSDYDKNWIGCDDTATSQFYGNCYTAWDDFGNGNRVLISTSTDGGLTWGAPTTNNVTVIGVQPIVQPSGTVVIVTANASETSILAFRSTNGGATWSGATTIAAVNEHRTAGGLRSGALPSAEIDAAGKIYAVWDDCRFRKSCGGNDVVMSTSADGTTWSTVARVPIDGVSSRADHFLPGIGVDRGTSGTTAKLGITYYFYPRSNCGNKCQLEVGFISSANGGTSWSAPTTVAGPMSPSWLADTSQGRMVGDYISTSISGGKAFGVFCLATAPSGSVFNEATLTFTGGLALTGGTVVNTAAAISSAFGQGTALVHRR